MNRIDDLIAELAPQGVHHALLSEVAEYSPTRVDAVELNESNFVGVDNLVADKGGRVDASYLPNTDRLTAYEPGDVLLGNIRPYLKKVWRATNAGGCSGDVLAIRIVPQRREQLSSEFLYYVLSSDRFFAYSMQHAKGAKMPRGNKAAILSYRIPVPPLEVQHQIVKILDQFTQLEAELEAELEARRQQYEHYRNDLLSFGDSVAQMAIGEVIDDLRTGLNPRQNFKLNAPGATNFYITVRELAGFTVRPTQKTDRVDDAGLARIQARSRLQAGDVLFSGTGTIGRTALVSDAPSDWNIKEGVYALTPKKDIIRPRFLIHLLRSGDIRGRILASADGSTVASVSMASLRRVFVPVPNLDEQDRRVELLDSFESLTNDLSIGLPAELAARRKQYEYYRDKLLTFEAA